MLPLPLSDSGAQAGHRAVTPTSTDVRKPDKGFGEVLSRQSKREEADANSLDTVIEDTLGEDGDAIDDVTVLGLLGQVQGSDRGAQFLKLPGGKSSSDSSGIRAKSEARVGAQTSAFATGDPTFEDAVPADPNPGSRAHAAHELQGTGRERSRETQERSVQTGELIKPAKMREHETVSSPDGGRAEKIEKGHRDPHDGVSRQSQYDIRQMAARDATAPRPAVQDPKQVEARAKALRATGAPDLRRRHDSEGSNFTPPQTDRPVATMAVNGAASAQAPVLMARHAAGQVAIAVSTNPDGVTEIALNPEELGRVKLRLSAHEGAITLHVQADRPETTDLLRRHLDVLAQEFRDLGYEAISFSFGEQGQGASSEQPTRDDTMSELHQTDIPSEATFYLGSVATGLDLRI